MLVGLRRKPIDVWNVRLGAGVSKKIPGWQLVSGHVYLVLVAGASEQTQRVTYVNGNWTAGKEGGGGSFELQVVTEDEARHALRVTSEEVIAVVAMTQASSVMLWDPSAQTLIAANLAGEWIQPTWSSGDQRQAGPAH